MPAIVTNFLAAHGSILVAVVVFNAIMSGVVVVLNKLSADGVQVPAVLASMAKVGGKIVDFLTANVEHK